MFTKVKLSVDLTQCIVNIVQCIIIFYQTKMILFIVKILNLFHTFIAVNLQSPITTLTNLCASCSSEFQLLSILLYINVNYFIHVYYNINLNINL